MRKNMKKNKILKVAIVVVLSVSLVCSAVPAIFTNDLTWLKKYQSKDDPILTQSERSSLVWEDEFNDDSYIDSSPPGDGISENYVVESGVAKMINTYPEWTDPSWTKIRPITLTNAGSQLLSYVLSLTIDYDADMQSDYDDIRFKHEEDPASWLDYWVESKNSSSAIVWVNIPTIPTGESTLYLFYGNPGATDQSDFYSVFTSWNKEWTNDEKISNHADNEGAWDPDVAYGSSRFLVAWEEGTYPYPPYTYFYKQEIRASIFDTDGNIIVNDFGIQEGSGVSYRWENPSIAFGSNKFFVAYEHYSTPSDISSMNIKGRLVTTSGSVGSEIDICSQSNIQADPNVAFDSTNNRFCVVWEDARSGTSNFNIYGKLYSTDGTQIGSEKTISGATDNQGEPWVVFDSINNHYMIVWEEGETPSNGPFDIWVGLFDSNLNLIGPGPGPSAVKLADGDSNTDYNFPCVSFCEETERFLVTWNDGDISDGDWHGNVWGTILDYSGNIVVSTFQIKSGNYIRTDIVSYLSTSFLVSYDDGDKIWGRIVSSDGDVFSDQIQLSASSSADADWANMAVGEGKIFVSWEDIRVSYPSPWNSNPDVFGNIWNLDIPIDSQVTYTVGTEQEFILSAYITSVAVEPENITSWDEFNAVFSGDITFYILDGNGNILISDISSGASIQSIESPSIRLMAQFSRTNPSSSPILDKWNVSWTTNTPPSAPSNPSPSDGALDVDLDANLSWTCSDPDGDSLTYDVYFGTSSPPTQVAWNQSTTTFDPGTLDFYTTYYWKIVAWDNHDDSTAGPIWDFTTEVNNPPYQPNNPSPSDDATGIDVNVDLYWDGGDPDGDPVTYDVYFGTASPPPKVVWNQSDTTYDPGTLDYETTYHWQIVAWDNHGASTAGPIWDFTTALSPNNPPYVPSNPNPANHSTDVNIDADLSWTGGDPDGDPVTYDIYFGTTSPPPLVISDHSSTSYDPGTMESDTQHFWKIIAWDNRGASTEGPIWDFTTEFIPNNPPYTPSDPNPSHHAINVTINSDLSWTGGDPDGDPVTYDVYFGATSPPTKIVNNQSSTTYDPGVLSYETIYYWQIIAWDDSGDSTSGAIWDFTTEDSPNNAPDPPIDPSPSDNATEVPLNPALSVYVSDIDGDALNVSFYNASNDDLIGIDTDVPSGTRASTTWYGLDFNTTYSWYAVAEDKEDAAQSDTWEFTTAFDNTPPDIPIVPSGPSSGRPDKEYNFTTSTVDPDGHQVYYNFSWGDGNFSGWLGPYNSGENATASYSWIAVGNYGISVKAKDTYDDESEWSDALQISISAAIEIENLETGYIYLSDLGYGYLRILDTLRIAVVLDFELYVEAKTNSEVEGVKFVATNIIWGIDNIIWDNDSTDGFSCYLPLSRGLYNVTVYAYDEDDNEIGSDNIPIVVFIEIGSEKRLLLRR